MLESKALPQDRLFVPLADAPFRWFASGEKTWELRRFGRQYTPDHVRRGRRVELRRGYGNKQAVLWGRIEDVRTASSLDRLFEEIPFEQVIPTARDRAEAVQIAAGIIGSDTDVIAFRVELDPPPELPLSSDYLPMVISGLKRSTVRKGARQIGSRIADLVSGAQRVRVMVTDLDIKPFEALTDDEARRDGFENLLELENALRRFYPNLRRSDPVTIIGFVPLERTSG